MSGTDKAKNKARHAGGRDKSTGSDGKGDLVKAKLKDAGEKVEDAFV